MKIIAIIFSLICFQATAGEIPQVVAKNFDQPFLIGFDQLKFWGLKVYDIALWSEDAKFSYDKKFAIQIHYNMNFDREELAKKSLEEIELLHDLSASTKVSYLQQLTNIFHSIKKGDEKIALFSPKEGVLMFYNNELIGKISDKKLARLFVDIWLDERGSYPKITKKLLNK